jgi:6-pyruvoyl-tetrahydropterin synthase
MRLKIRHDMQVAHRLTKTPGKCQNIHGHGMDIELVFTNLVYDESTGMAMNGFLEPFEFGDMKLKFRKYINETYDHRLVLNQNDVWAGPIYQMQEIKTWVSLKEIEETSDSPRDVVDVVNLKLTNEQQFLPGVSLVPDDPTVENLAKWIAEWAAREWRTDVICRLEETKSNGAEMFVTWNGFKTKVMQ